jgi:hypothetical protein
MEEEYALVCKLKEDNNELMKYLLFRVVWAIRWSALLIFSVGGTVITTLIPSKPMVILPYLITDYLRELLAVLMMPVVVFSFLQTRIVCSEALRMLYQVNHFETYIKNLESEMMKLTSKKPKV